MFTKDYRLKRFREHKLRKVKDNEFSRQVGIETFYSIAKMKFVTGVSKNSQLM